MASSPLSVEVHNPDGRLRVVSTKPMPGSRWINLLIGAGCRVEICTEKKTILSIDDIKNLMGSKCDGIIGQLTEDWGDALFSALKEAGGHAFSNMAVGYNNVDVDAATRNGIAVGNTPGVLTETTAELAASLTLAAARRVVEADSFMRAGKYDGWLPTLFIGNLLKGQTVGIIGAGRIGSAYARMMDQLIYFIVSRLCGQLCSHTKPAFFDGGRGAGRVSLMVTNLLMPGPGFVFFTVEGFKMNVVYYDLYQATRLEKFVTAYGKLLESQGESPVTWERVQTVEDVLKVSDVVSLHPVLDKTTFHLINKERLAVMKKEAVLVNASRGPIIDEAALVSHLQANPEFRAALDVFEDEPFMKPGLAELPNVVVVPHIASASKWTREGMATLAAANVLGKLKGYPIWHDPNNVAPFLDENAEPPSACPSIINAKDLGLKTMAA